MHDMVVLGAARVPGEVVAIQGDTATIQAYEYTGGLAPGHPAEPEGRPLSVRMAPDLLGGVFDGLLRPWPVPETSWQADRVVCRTGVPGSSHHECPRERGSRPETLSGRSERRCRSGSWHLRADRAR